MGVVAVVLVLTLRCSEQMYPRMTFKVFWQEHRTRITCMMCTYLHAMQVGLSVPFHHSHTTRTAIISSG